MGRASSKRRKLYNGKLPCQLFQYFGRQPPSERTRDARSPASPTARDSEASPTASTTAATATRASDATSAPRAAADVSGDDKVLAGDWACPRCKTLVFASRDTCFQCGYEKRNDWACRVCQTLVFASKSTCFKCGTPHGGGNEGGGEGGGRGGGRGGGGAGGSRSSFSGGARSARGGGGQVKMAATGAPRSIVDVSVLFLFLSQGSGKLGGFVTRQSEGEGVVPVYSGDGSRGGEEEEEEEEEAAGSWGVSRSEGGGGLEGWDPTRKEWQRVGSWVCMKQVLNLLALLVQKYKY